MKPLLAPDLLGGADVLAERLDDALREEQWLDAFLLAAGLNQVIEDRLHPDPLLLRRTAGYLSGSSSPAARVAAGTADLLGAVLNVATGPTRRKLLRIRPELDGLVARLATQVVAPRPIDGPTMPVLPTLDAEPPRVPSCFRSFDQHPDDVTWLVDAFRRRYPETGVPLCVVGVRTSGSYLAPLHAAALRAAGTSHVETLTYRPGRPFLRSERSVLTATARAGGFVLVVDDPPGSGTSLATTASAIGRAGVPDGRIVLLLSLFGAADDVPATLRRWPVVIQEWAEWSVHRRLAAHSVRPVLAGMAGAGVALGEVQPLGWRAPANGRGHVRRRFEVRFSDRRTGKTDWRQILVEGAGLGYFGRQSIAVADALPAHVPRVYGFADGLLYRDWLPSRPSPEPLLVRTVADYVVARQRSLPASSASVRRLGGRDPVWEVAATLLAAQYGRLSPPVRPVLFEPIMRRLLANDAPTVVDGKTGHRHWLPDPSDAGRLRKVDFYQRAFSHLELTCYDPVFDLAGAAADPPGAGFESRLRAAYADAGGCPVDGERWLLYRLTHLWRLGRAGDLDGERVHRRSAAAVHDYLAELFLRDLPPATGPLCALDLDGVLECDSLGYPVTSPTGMRALRALIAHGYRPVPVTGRSLPEVRDRCAAFGLAGGVAEYGGVILVDNEVADLRPPAARVLLDRVRRELSVRPEVRIDPRYRYSVRARTAKGPVPAEWIPAVPGTVVVQGQGQTDITAAGIDKGAGLRVLTARLSAPGCALAVGDSPADLPMLAAASLARAPRNARFGDEANLTFGPPVTLGHSRPPGTRLTSRGYQAGLVQACRALLGHHPGRCPVCRPPGLPSRTRTLLAILDLRANGLASVPCRTAALGVSLLRRY